MVIIAKVKTKEKVKQTTKQILSMLRVEAPNKAKISLRLLSFLLKLEYQS